MRRVIEASVPEISRLYQKELARNPELKGRILSRFLIDENGEFLELDFNISKIDISAVMLKELSEILKELLFIPPGDHQIKVSYLFLFLPS